LNSQLDFNDEQLLQALQDASEDEFQSFIEDLHEFIQKKDTLDNIIKVWNPPINYTVAKPVLYGTFSLSY